MKFAGFPAGMEYTPVPNLFINRLAPGMNGAELTVLLCIFKILYKQKSRPRFVSESDLLGDPAVTAALKGDDPGRGAALNEILKAAATQDVLLPLEVNRNNAVLTLYFLNTPADRAEREKIKSGEIKVEGLGEVRLPATNGPKIPNIFSLYEDNIGLLTPMIAEELKDALVNYPEEWIAEAIKEAATLNKRSWRYIARILERWVTEGKNHGTHQSDNEDRNSDKFFRGRLGPLVQR